MNLTIDSDWQTYKTLANSYNESGKYNDAIDLYRKCLPRFDQKAEILHGMGWSYGFLGEWDVAINCYQQAIQEYPHSVDLYNCLADALFIKERWKSAIEAFQKVLTFGRSSTDIHYKLGCSFLKVGNSQDAFEHFKKAEKLDPLLFGIESQVIKSSGVLDMFDVNSDDELYQRWKVNHTPREVDLMNMRNVVNYIPYKPIISVIMPVYNTPIGFLRDAIESVISQIYPNWELCIADDLSTDPQIRKILEEYRAKDSRIKIYYRGRNGHISEASNSALKLASGEFVALLDHDDVITPDALYEVVVLLNNQREVDMVYSDEDKMGGSGKLLDPFFKPDWGLESFLSRMYTCHLGVYRKSIIDKIGGFRVGYEGSQDWDLCLRFIKHTDKVAHIPKVLYHWRIHSRSTSGSASAKPYAYEASKKALNDFLSTQLYTGKAIPVVGRLGFYMIKYDIKNYKKVSIIIPSKDLGDMLDRCLNSIFTKTTYPNYEVVVINNGSVEPKTYDIFRKWKKKESRFRVINHDAPFNFSEINNFAVSKVDGEFLLFLNNDTEVISEEWIDYMVGHVQRPEIGAVGVMLLFPDNKIQHAGVIMGMAGVAGHQYYAMPHTIDGYHGNIIGNPNISVVTGACMMCRKDTFNEVGGFDEQLKVAYNDVDLCLKFLEKGYRNVLLPHVNLYHYESKSRGYEDTHDKIFRLNEELAVIKNRWKKYIDHDPAYSPHLTKRGGCVNIQP